jgi:hypothetical protein
MMMLCKNAWANCASVSKEASGSFLQQMAQAANQSLPVVIQVKQTII